MRECEGFFENVPHDFPFSFGFVKYCGYLELNLGFFFFCITVLAMSQKPHFMF